jgi:multiple sugar transport system substrate-binding protein
MHLATSAVAARPAHVHRSRRPSGLRRALAAVLALPLALGLVACGDDTPAADPNAPVTLSFFFWGGEARAKLTEDALALYKAKHPNVTVKTTWQANQGYFDKLATLTAGNDAPDIFQIDDNYLTEYAGRATLDLTSYTTNGKLSIAKFPESLAKYGVVDGKLSGVAFGENTPGMVFSKTKIAALGVEEPQTGWTWEQLITWATAATTKAGGKYYGTMDPSADYKAFWMWVRQQGKQLYNGTQLGFTKEDLTRWFELWKGARDAKAAPPADIINVANGGDVTKQLVVTGQALTSFMWANQMPELAKNTKDQLGVVAYPGDPSAQWARASMYLSVFRNSKNKDAAVDVINFLVNDLEAGKVLGTERGLPSNLDVRSAVATSVTDANMKTSIAFENDLTPKFGPAPPVPPKGHATVRSELRKAAESVQYGRAAPAAAAEAFFTAATAALSG